MDLKIKTIQEEKILIDMEIKTEKEVLSETGDQPITIQVLSLLDKLTMITGILFLTGKTKEIIYQWPHRSYNHRIGLATTATVGLLHVLDVDKKDTFLGNAQIEPIVQIIERVKVIE